MKKYPFGPAVVYAGLILICGVIPPTYLREARSVMAPFAFILSDSNLHGLGFGVFAGLLCGGYVMSGRRSLPLIKIIGLSLGYGLFIELVQIPLPYRFFEWPDFFADGVGILAAVLLFSAYLLFRNRRNPVRPRD